MFRLRSCDDGGRSIFCLSLSFSGKQSYSLFYLGPLFERYFHNRLSGRKCVREPQSCQLYLNGNTLSAELERWKGLVHRGNELSVSSPQLSHCAAEQGAILVRGQCLHLLVIFSFLGGGLVWNDEMRAHSCCKNFGKPSVPSMRIAPQGTFRGCAQIYSLPRML